MTKVMLDLFSGTGSVKKAFAARGYKTVTLDRDHEADFKVDIMQWDYKKIKPRTFKVIHASPPCTEYSRAKTTGVRDIAGANKIVRKTLEIIRYFQPDVFIIENPQTGLLKEQPFMRNIPYADADYCKYGMPYRKRTRFWSNRAKDFKLKPLCQNDCGQMDETGKRHKEQAQLAPSEGSKDWGHHTQEDLYKIPRGLINDIIDSI
jgi:site-specific DNA-cytosine methylase